MTAPRRALLVIDVQYEYIDGALPIAHPPLSVSLPRIGAAIAAARAAGIPVVAVQHCAPPTAAAFATGSPGWRLHPVIADGYAHLIKKSLPSAFAGTDLGAWLSNHAIDTLTVAGFMTQNCNASTIFEAMHTGLRVEYLHDASGALPYANAAGDASAQEIHRAFCAVFHARFAAVLDTASWIDALRAGTPVAMDNIVASFQRACTAPLA